MGASEEQVHLVFDLETQRVRALTVVRHSAVSVCVLAVDEMRIDAGDDLYFATILYTLTPVST